MAHKNTDLLVKLPYRTPRRFISNNTIENTGQASLCLLYVLKKHKCVELVCAAFQLVIDISRIILVYYCKCCNLIGYSTRYLFLDR